MPALAISSPCLLVGVCVVCDLGVADIVVESCDAVQCATVPGTEEEDGLRNDALTAAGPVDGHAHVVAGTDDAVPRDHRADAD